MNDHTDSSPKNPLQVTSKIQLDITKPPQDVSQFLSPNSNQQNLLGASELVNISSGQQFFPKRRSSRQYIVQQVEQRASVPQNSHNISLSNIHSNERPSIRDIYINKNNLSQKNKQQGERSRSTTKLLQTLKVKLFAQKLLALTQIGRFNKFQKHQQNIVDDKATFIQNSTIANKLDGQPSMINGPQKTQIKHSTSLFTLKGLILNSQIFSKFMDNLNKIPVLSPSGNFKFLWDIVMMIVIVAYLFMIPIEITFNKPLKDLFPYYILLFCNIALILDFILQWNFGYFEKGLPNMNRIQVMAKYFKLQVYLDLTSSFFLVVNFFQSDSYVNQFHLLFFLRFKNAKLFFKKIEERYNLNPLIKQFSSLIQLLLLIVTVSHIIGCVWISVAQYESDMGQSSWISDKNVRKDDWIANYIHAYYYSTVTMITVGYGDIRPTNTLEMVVSIMTMLSSCGVFAYSINAIGTIFNSINQKKTDKVNNLFTIGQYMAKKNINFELQIQIKEYLEYYWDMQNTRDIEEESNLISQLSPQLKERLLHETFKMIIQDYPIFRNNFSQEFMMNMISVIQEFSYRPEEMIISELIDEDHSLYFIESGKVSVFMDEEGTKVLKYLKKGEMFGDYSFFTGQSININIKALEFTQVFKIKRSSFLPLLQKYPQDHEIFCNIQDSLLYQQNYGIINTRCYLCSQPHLLHNCQQAFPQLNKIRGPPNRRKMLNKYPTFVHFDEQTKKLIKFIVDYSKEIELYNNKYLSNDEDEDFEEDEEDYYEGHEHYYNEGEDPSSKSFNIYSQQDVSPYELTKQYEAPKQKSKDKIILQRTLSDNQKKGLEIPLHPLDEEKESPLVKSPKALRNKSNLTVGFTINSSIYGSPKNNANTNTNSFAEQGLINLKRVQSSPNSKESIGIDSPLTKKRNLSKISSIQTNFKNQTPQHSQFYQSEAQQQLQQLQEIVSPQIRNIESPLTKQNRQRFSRSFNKAESLLQREQGLQGAARLGDQNKINELAEHIQQLIGLQKQMNDQKDLQVENEYFDLQKNFEFYLPHNNLSYIIEYLKFKSRFLKQLKISQRANPAFKTQFINMTETYNLENVINQKNAYLYQYPFNTTSCNRNFQIQRVFDKKVQMQKLKKNQKLNRTSFGQQYNLKQNKKGIQVNTRLQRLLEKYEFLAQQQDHSDAASIVNSLPNNNFNSYNYNQLSNQLGETDMEELPSVKQKNSQQNRQKPIKQSTFFNQNNHNNNSTTPQNNNSHAEVGTPNSQSFQNYMEKKRRFSTISISNNNPFQNSYLPDFTNAKINFNLNLNVYDSQNREISFKEEGEEEEIVSADRPKFTRIHSTHNIAPKDQYFTEDTDFIATPSGSQRPTIQQELQLNKIMKNIQSNSMLIPKRKNNYGINKLDSS